MITENLEQVRKNIDEACRMAGRDPKEVTLIAVSKTKPVSMLKEAYDAGARALVKIRYRRSWTSIHSFLRIFSGT